MGAHTFLAFLVLGLAAASANARFCPKYKVLVFLDTSRDAAGLERTVNKFRAGLGGIDNGNEPGPLAEGHRSINWDADVVPFDMPGNFFDVTVTRGALFRARGGKFAVSNPAVPPPDDDRFDSLVPRSVSKQFVRFSLERLFTPVLKNRYTASFKIPASNKRASVTGFGAVFTDVDLKKKTFMAFFDKNGCLIAKVFVPPRNRGLSFAGIIVLDKRKRKRVPVIRRVVTKLGTLSIADVKKRKGDVVVLDDLIYGEPQ